MFVDVGVQVDFLLIIIYLLKFTWLIFFNLKINKKFTQFLIFFLLRRDKSKLANIAKVKYIYLFWLIKH